MTVPIANARDHFLDRVRRLVAGLTDTVLRPICDPSGIVLRVVNRLGGVLAGLAQIVARIRRAALATQL